MVRDPGLSHICHFLCSEYILKVLNCTGGLEEWVASLLVRIQAVKL